MEFPHLGKHCSFKSCNKLDFLPVKCDACGGIFCHEHMKYAAHMCPEGNALDVQVPVCPLCNKPVPLKRGEPPDISVGDHIDRDCQSDPATDRRKVYTNKCSMKGCRKKEVVKILCADCHHNYCISHRHPDAHNCQRKATNIKAPVFSSTPSRNGGGYEAIQGNLGEDEALARAIALSLEGNTNPVLYRESTNGSTNVEETRSTSKPNQNNDTTCVIC